MTNTCGESILPATSPTPHPPYARALVAAYVAPKAWCAYNDRNRHSYLSEPVARTNPSRVTILYSQPIIQTVLHYMRVVLVEDSSGGMKIHLPYSTNC